jgi:hypothetical protein
MESGMVIQDYFFFSTPALPNMEIKSEGGGLRQGSGLWFFPRESKTVALSFFIQNLPSLNVQEGTKNGCKN